MITSCLSSSISRMIWEMRAFTNSFTNVGEKNDILVDELMMEIHDIHEMRRWGGLGSTGWRLVVW